MLSPKIKVSKELYEKLNSAAQAAGCSSMEEFAQGILEREADRTLERAGKNEAGQDEINQIAQKLKGLGYLD